ncbi:MAG: ATP synthase F0 subunit C, partial [Polyangiales bacterium]
MSLKKTAAATGAALATIIVPSLAFAQAAAEEVGRAATNVNDVKSWSALAAGIAIGAAALGGTTGQGRATAAALD